MQRAAGLHFRGEHPAAAVRLGFDHRLDVCATVASGQQLVKASAWTVHPAPIVDIEVCGVQRQERFGFGGSDDNFRRSFDKFILER
jgi:hypothetical protein